VLPQKPPPGSFWGRHKLNINIRMVISSTELAVAAALRVLTEQMAGLQIVLRVVLAVICGWGQIASTGCALEVGKCD
jgi:hypothetical protein